ncbi:MAG: urea transporter [Candidatus Obscuribacterales bacterium]|nr:urea transporter [Candidatus Obscuribacterales bacterium]
MIFLSIKKILDAYGSFFALSHPASRVLIFTCAVLQPCSGACGVLGALCVLLWRRLLRFQGETERIEVINGLLLGMLMGSLYVLGPATLIMTVAGALAVVLASALFSDTLGKKLNLPLLGLPYSLIAFMLLPLADSLQIQHAGPAIVLLPLRLDPLLPLGAMYFNGTGLGGLLVFIAFLLSSRYLAMLALLASIASSAFLELAGIPSLSILSIVARMNSVLAACVIGGLFAVPGKKSLLVSVSASVMAAALSLSLNRLLSVLGLPVLALPFVLVTYVCMLVFTAQRGSFWTHFWLSVPALPEVSLEQLEIAQARGTDYRRIGLKLPLRGVWQIYQGFDGTHTHKGNWQYALDFFKTQEGLSFANSGTELENYFAFGKQVLSPAYATVVDFRNDLKDNRPGDVDTVNNWGNYVLLRLDCGYYVILAHLQESSIRTFLGARVSPGDVLALVGNSGRSPQPHLHMHVQETAFLGSRTLPFHLAGVILHSEMENTYSLKACPEETSILSAPSTNLALKRSLRLAVGNRFLFKTDYANGTLGVRKLEVLLDLNGQFWLESDRGARVAFSMTDELLAFYDRRGPEDIFLDAFVLSFGTTPLVEGALSWSDSVPRRLLPRSNAERLLHAILYPFKPCAESLFKRSWDSMLKVWSQKAEHKIGYWSCSTSAVICEAQGLLDFELIVGESSLVKAHLLSMGAKEDNGIPAWSTSLPRVSEI